MTPPLHTAFSARFLKQSNKDRAAAMEAYMKGHFTFYGVPSPARKSIQKEVFRNLGMPGDDTFEAEVRACWVAPHREMQYVAMECMERKKWYRKEQSIQLIEWMITERSWWDSVDYIAATLCGGYFQYFPERIYSVVSRWNASENIWLIRSSLLFQLRYRDKVDKDLLTSLMLPHLDSKEFFLQKAIGWILRQVSKSDPTFVRAFVDSHSLSAVTLREAKKYI
ncbi:MAG: DNA alkylation repair protein [Flavobacteriales bacterium]|nr:DNA alkylation repair protein [Flavobacteriales bacterium]